MTYIYKKRRILATETKRDRIQSPRGFWGIPNIIPLGQEEQSGYLRT